MHFEPISDRLSRDFRTPEYLLNQLAYRMLQDGNDKDRSEALGLFLLNVENYPGSSNSYDRLGEAYETVGDTQKAIENYKRSPELDTGNEHANRKVKALKQSE